MTTEIFSLHLNLALTCMSALLFPPASGRDAKLS